MDSNNPYMNLSRDELLRLAREEGIDIKEDTPPQKTISKDRSSDFFKELLSKDNLKEQARKFGVGARGVAAGIGDLDFGLFGTGDAIEKGIDSLTGGKFKPRTKEEKVSHDASRVLSGIAVPGVGASKALASGSKLVGPAKKFYDAILHMQKVDPTIRSLASASGAGLAAHAAAEKAQEIGNNPLLPSLAYGMGVGSAIHAIPSVLKTAVNFASHPKGSLSRGLRKISGYSPERAASFERAGITPTLGDLTKGKMTKAVQASTSKLGGEPIEEIGRIRPREIMHSLGVGESPGTKASMGKDILDTLQNLKLKSRNQFKDKLNAFESAREKAGMENIDIMDTYKELSKKIPKNVHLEALEDWKKSKAGKYFQEITNMLASGQPITYESVQNLQQRIGSQLKDKFGLSGDSHVGALKNLYSGLISDIGKQIQKVPDNNLRKELLKTYPAYREHWSNYKSSQEGIINQAIKDSRESADKVYRTFLRSAKDGKQDFSLILSELPSEKRKEFMSDFVYNMGLDSKSNFNGSQLAKNYYALTPEHKKVFRESFNKATGFPETRIDDVMDVLKHSSETVGEKNFSGSGLHQVLWKMLLGGGASTALQQLFTGRIDASSAVVAPIIGWGVSYAANKGIFANQKFLNFLAYGNKVKHKNQIPILLNKLESVPGIDKKMVHRFKNTINKQIFSKTERPSIQHFVQSSKIPSKEEIAPTHQDLDSISPEEDNFSPKDQEENPYMNLSPEELLRLAKEEGIDLEDDLISSE